MERKVLRPLPFKHKSARLTAKCLFRQEPGTRATLLNRTNRLLDFAAAAGLPPGLDGLLNPLHLHIIFKSTGAHLRGETRWGLCTALWRMAWELRHEDVGWVLIGGRRYRLKDDGKIRPVDPDLPDHVRARAREMRAEIPPGALNVRQALKLRTAAHAMLQAELCARRSEIALQKMSEPTFTPAGLTLLLDGANSKMRVNGREKIATETTELLQDYLRRGRPTLLGSGADDLSRALWITEDGRDAEAAGMAGALARGMRGLRPDGVYCTDLRRAGLSQEGQSFADMARLARHVPGSNTGSIKYMGRDRAKAVASGIGLSALGEDDVPSFAPPAPGKRLRK